MGYWEDLIAKEHLGIFIQKVTCKKCSKDYKQFTQDQVPGCRQRKDDVCPYCFHVNNSSMQIEYYNEEIM